MAKKHPISQYLNSYAEPESILATSLPFVYQQALVIPVYDEDENFIQQLASAFIASTEPCLLILVVNAPEQVCYKKLAKNKTLIEHINSNFQSFWQHQHLTLYQWLSHHHLLVVNRSQPALFIPPQQGVGLARKIGADIACQLFHQQKLLSPWLFSSDADVSLPNNYFNACSHLPPTTSAAVFDFIHCPLVSSKDEKQLIAQLLYDIKLRYYVAALTWANSPFAYHTIGSLLAINIHHYCQARGFPKRAGGEDFYCLNKLAKLGEIAQLTPRIQVTARLSDRVPFGTGPALSNISQLTAPVSEYQFYHPTCFSWLKLTLSWLTNSLASLLSQKDSWQQLFATFCQQQKITSHHNQQIQQVLEWLGINKLIQHTLKQPPTPEQWQSAITHWFDGFRTLKFIHLSRDHFLPSLPLQQLIINPLFKDISLWGTDKEPNLVENLIASLKLIESKLHFNSR